LPDDGAHVVHGAAITPHAYTEPSGRQRDPEKEDPMRVLTVNIMGTAQALNWARNRKNAGRFVYVSTGSVYADAVPEQEKKFFPLPEDGYTGPTALYDVTKYSSEMIARRFKQLYAMDLAIVRLSSVFGPVDRQTDARKVRNFANHVAHAAVEGRILKSDSAEAVGDYVYAPDVADGLRRLLDAPRKNLHHDVYNLACGVTTKVSELISHAAAAVPGFTMELVDAGKGEFKTQPDRKTGKWAAYDVSRAERDFGWRPRPLETAMRDYIAWLRVEEK
jgi:UDP-glucose 4-epimerase